METHNNSAIMFHKSAHGQLSCWFKLWAFSFFILFFFPQVSRSYWSNLGILSKNACRTKAGHYVLAYRDELWQQNNLPPTPWQAVCVLWVWWGYPEVRVMPHEQDEFSAQAFQPGYSALAEEWQLLYGVAMALCWICNKGSLIKRGHRPLSPLGSLKLYPPPHSVIQTHTHTCKYSFFPLTVSQAV